MFIKFALALAVAPAFAGCSGAPGPAPTVNTDLARETLVKVLDHWKSGNDINSLKNGSPSIVVQDFDWMAGSKLVAYEVTSEGKFDDANLRIPVAITILPAKGKEKKKTVSYVVGTSPTLTVFREFN